MCMKGILKQYLNYQCRICKQDNADELFSISTLFWHKPHSSRQKIIEIWYKQTLTCVHWNEVVLNFAVSVICCLFSESLVIRCGHWLSIQRNQTQANVWRGQKDKINLQHHCALRLWQISRPQRLLTRPQMFIRLWIFNPLDPCQQLWYLQDEKQFSSTCVKLLISWSHTCSWIVSILQSTADLAVTKRVIAKDRF